MSRNDTILIVEDNELSLKMAKSLLQLAGFSTLEANNAETGIHLAKEHQPSLILMDMHLPVKSGYEACRELKATSETGDIPIVAFTALAMEEERNRAIANGCASVISKPIDIKQFAQTVKSFLKTRQATLLEEPVLNAPCARMLFPCPPPEVDSHPADGNEWTEQDFEEFLFQLSHDMQGPLRKIQQFTQFLENPVAGQESRLYVQGISRSAQELELQLHSLLTLFRIRYQTETFTDVSLAEVVRRAVDRYRTEIKARNAIVVVDELITLQADVRKMQMVFEELLANSLKFMREGESPAIRIQGRSLGNGFYEITLQDNGIGLNEANTERIFKPFQRLNAAGQYPGCGMGLAIVKRIIDCHGGTIAARTSATPGTAMIITLPVIQASRPDTQSQGRQV